MHPKTMQANKTASDTLDLDLDSFDISSMAPQKPTFSNPLRHTKNDFQA
jgi:hypothetical protein